MNSSPWRLEEVDDGDEQCPESPVLQYATPLPMNKSLFRPQALKELSVSYVLSYATALPIKRTPFRP